MENFFCTKRELQQEILLSIPIRITIKGKIYLIFFDKNYCIEIILKFAIKILNHLSNQIQQSYFICGKNLTAFQPTINRQQPTGKSFNFFIYFLICRNLWADCYTFLKRVSTSVVNTFYLKTVYLFDESDRIAICSKSILKLM